MRILHVHQNRIRANIKKESKADMEPPIIIREGRKRDYAFECAIEGPCRLVYRPHDPLDCGARLWIETESQVTVLDPLSDGRTKPIPTPPSSAVKDLRLDYP